MYTPDNWVIIKITHPDETLYKILAGWSGGYLDGDAWRMNSGITRIEEEGDYILFIGHSDSIYKCHKSSETLRMNCSFIWDRLKAAHPDMVKLIDYSEFVKEFN